MTFKIKKTDVSMRNDQNYENIFIDFYNFVVVLDSLDKII